MSNIKRGEKATVSTSLGISKSVSNSLGVLEISGPALTSITQNYSECSIDSSNIPQFTIGATNIDGILQTGVKNDGNSFMQSSINGNSKNLLLQPNGGNVGVGIVGTSTPDCSLHIDSTDAIVLPRGNTSERPNPAFPGMLRFNTELNQYEGYVKDTWRDIRIQSNSSYINYITTENTFGSDDDELSFYMNNSKKIIIDISRILIGMETKDSTDEALTINNKIYLQQSNTDNIGIVYYKNDDLNKVFTISNESVLLSCLDPSNSSVQLTKSIDGSGNYDSLLTVYNSGNVSIGDGSHEDESLLYIKNTTNAVTELMIETAVSGGGFGGGGLGGGVPGNEKSLIQMTTQTKDSQLSYYGTHFKINSMEIDNTGNIGINTSPDVNYKININGNAKSNACTIVRNYGIYINTPKESQVPAHHTNAPGHYEIRGRETGNGDSGHLRLRADKSFIDLTGLTANAMTNQVIRMYTDSHDRVTISSNGNVGVGIPNPLYALDVNGVTYADSIETPYRPTYGNTDDNWWSGYPHYQTMQTATAPADFKDQNFIKFHGTNTDGSNSWDHTMIKQSHWSIPAVDSIPPRNNGIWYGKYGDELLILKGNDNADRVRFLAPVISFEGIQYEAGNFGATGDPRYPYKDTNTNYSVMTISSSGVGFSTQYDPEYVLDLGNGSLGMHKYVGWSYDGMGRLGRTGSTHGSLFIDAQKAGSGGFYGIGWPTSGPAGYPYSLGQLLATWGYVGFFFNDDSNNSGKWAWRCNYNSETVLTWNGVSKFETRLTGSHVFGRVTANYVLVNTTPYKVTNQRPLTVITTISHAWLIDPPFGGAGGHRYTTTGLWPHQEPYIAYGLYSSKDIRYTSEILIASDRRIKSEIEDYPDSESLEQLREIDMYFFHYINKYSASGIVQIGAIAQHVAHIVPDAVTYRRASIPDVYTNLIDISWVNIIENNIEKFKMSCSQISSSIIGNLYYEFRVSDNITSDATTVQLKAGDDHSFIFDKKWNCIFCIGRIVNDSHILAYEHLHTMNFSATKELDKIQISHQQDLRNMEITLNTHDNDISNLEDNFNNILNSLNDLETKMRNVS
jgi:hypothetical protein